MHDDIHTVESPFEPGQIAHIADEIAQVGVVEARHAHLMLFELIPAVNDQPRRVNFFQHDFDEFMPE